MTMVLGILMACYVLAMPAQAQAKDNGQWSLFTDHTLVHMFRHGVNANQDVRFATGKVPYIGRLGIEYERSKFTYSAGYVHRSNADIAGDEYNYDGGFISIKIKQHLF